MNDLTFDEIIDYAATHTSVLSGAELIRVLKDLFIRYDEIRERERIAGFIHTLLSDLNFYEENPQSCWTEQAIFQHMNKYEI